VNSKGQNFTWQVKIKDFIRQTDGGPKIGENFSMPSQKSIFF
jgi:hypothetical protein